MLLSNEMLTYTATVRKSRRIYTFNDDNTAAFVQLNDSQSFEMVIIFLVVLQYNVFKSNPYVYPSLEGFIELRLGLLPMLAMQQVITIFLTTLIPVSQFGVALLRIQLRRVKMSLLIF